MPADPLPPIPEAALRQLADETRNERTVVRMATEILRLRGAANPELLEHALCHALVGRLERALNLDPCPAISLANELSAGIMAEVLKYAGELNVEGTEN